jgi:hypothetical protein
MIKRSNHITADSFWANALEKAAANPTACSGEWTVRVIHDAMKE